MNIEFQQIFDGLMLGDGSLRIKNTKDTPKKNGAARLLGAHFKYKGKHELVAKKYKQIFIENGIAFPEHHPKFSPKKGISS